MISNSLLTQIIIAALAVGIIVSYIRPAFARISEQQASILETRAEKERISEVNQTLASLVERLNDISQSDIRALNTYLPDEVDEVRVLKDITEITRSAGVRAEQLAYGGEVTISREALGDSATTPGIEMPAAHQFSLQLVGSYLQVKQFLTLIERNDYPLHISDISFGVTEGGFINVEVKLLTYAHKHELE